MFHEIFNQSDIVTKTIKSVIDRILSCKDSSDIVEIYAKDGSFRNGSFANWVGLMIEVDGKFPNESLDDILDEIEQEDFKSLGFKLVISVEPNDFERGHGIILWERSDV